MAEYTIDAAAVRDRLVCLIRSHAETCRIRRVVLGISGGKDSSVAAALCARALGKENVYGVMMPDGEQKDLSDSLEVCRCLGIHGRIVNIGQMHKALLSAVEEPSSPSFPVDFSYESNLNVGPRLRMTTLRYIAQAIGAFLCGTGNLSEATVGYCTKDGDTSSDFNPLGALTSIEVVQVGLTLEELPRHLVEKPPADGLSGMTDEEKLGLKYSQIHDYIRLGSCGDAAIDETIRRKEQANMHKRVRPPILDPFQ